MAWIREVPPANATATPAGADARVHLWRALGQRPQALEALRRLDASLLGDPAPLTAAQAELVTLVCAATNGCGYAVAHHGERAARALGDRDLVRAVARDYREADLAARDRVLLDYAVALTCEPAERKLEDVERLREYGFDDAAIVAATELTGYAALESRLASALGVALEPDVEPWEFGAQR